MAKMSDGDFFSLWGRLQNMRTIKIALEAAIGEIYPPWSEEYERRSAEMTERLDAAEAQREELDAQESKDV